MKLRSSHGISIIDRSMMALEKILKIGEKIKTNIPLNRKRKKCKETEQAFVKVVFTMIYINSVNQSIISEASKYNRIIKQLTIILITVAHIFVHGYPCTQYCQN